MFSLPEGTPSHYRVFRADDLSSEVYALAMATKISRKRAAGFLIAVRSRFFTGLLSALDVSTLEMVLGWAGPGGLLVQGLFAVGILEAAADSGATLAGHALRYGTARGKNLAAWNKCPAHISAQRLTHNVGRLLSGDVIDGCALGHTVLSVMPNSGRITRALCAELEHRLEWEGPPGALVDILIDAECAQRTGAGDVQIANAEKIAGDPTQTERKKRSAAKARSTRDGEAEHKAKARARQAAKRRRDKLAMSRTIVTLKTAQNEHPEPADATERKSVTHDRVAAHVTRDTFPPVHQNHPPDAEFATLVTHNKRKEENKEEKTNNNELDTKHVNKHPDAAQHQAADAAHETSTEHQRAETKSMPSSYDQSPPWDDDDLPPPIDDPWQGRQDCVFVMDDEPVVVVQGTAAPIQEPEPDDEPTPQQPSTPTPEEQPRPQELPGVVSHNGLAITDPNFVELYLAGKRDVAASMQRMQNRMAERAAEQTAQPPVEQPDVTAPETRTNAPPSDCDTERESAIGSGHENAPQANFASLPDTQKAEVVPALKEPPPKFRLASEKAGDAKIALPDNLDMPVSSAEAFRAYMNRAKWALIGPVSQRIVEALTHKITYRELEIMRANFLDQQRASPSFKRTSANLGHALSVILSERRKAQLGPAKNKPKPTAPKGWKDAKDLIACDVWYDHVPNALLTRLWEANPDLSDTKFKQTLKTSHSWRQVAARLGTRWDEPGGGSKKLSMDNNHRPAQSVMLAPRSAVIAQAQMARVGQMMAGVGRAM
jgi:hypothetical protein